jgi:hypothetical protein
LLLWFSAEPKCDPALTVAVDEDPFSKTDSAPAWPNAEASRTATASAGITAIRMRLFIADSSQVSTTIQCRPEQPDKQEKPLKIKVARLGR